MILGPVVETPFPIIYLHLTTDSLLNGKSLNVDGRPQSAIYGGLRMCKK